MHNQARAAAGCSVLCTRPYRLSKIALIFGPNVHFTAADLGRFAIKRRPSGWRSGPLGGPQGSGNSRWSRVTDDGRIRYRGCHGEQCRGIPGHVMHIDEACRGPDWIPRIQRNGYRRDETADTVRR